MHRCLASQYFIDCHMQLSSPPFDDDVVLYYFLNELPPWIERHDVPKRGIGGRV